MWALFHVDLGEVFAGRRPARWAAQFVERLYEHPWSVVRAKFLGGERWSAWYGWGHVADKVAEGTNVLIAVNTPAGKAAPTVSTPDSVPLKPASLDDAFAKIMS